MVSRQKSLKSKVRIAYICDSTSFWGAEHSLCLLLDHLDRSRFEPTVLLPLEDGPFVSRLEQQDVSILRFPFQPFDRLRLPGFGSCVLSLWKRFRETRPDLVHINSVPASSAACWAARLAGTPSLSHVRNLVRYGAVAKLFHRPDLFVCNSGAARRHLIDFGFSPDRIRVVHNAVDLARFARRPDPAPFRNRYSLGSGPILGVVGQFTTGKGIEVAVAAFAKVLQTIPGAILLIVGEDPGDGTTKESLAKLADELKISRSVIWTGRLDCIPEVMAALDILLVPSHREAFGRVAVEAMAAGCPVVCTDAGGLPEIVIDGATGFVVERGDSEKMAERALQLLASPDLKEAFGEAGRRRALENFAPDKHTFEITTIYHEILSRKG